MKSRTFSVGYVLVLALFVFAQRHPGPSLPTGIRAVVDLTHAINARSLAYDSAERSAYQVKTVANIEKDNHFVRNLSSPEQPGRFETRIEAPAHSVRGLWTVDPIPTERLIAPLVVLDLSANVTNHPGLPDFSRGHCRMGEGSRPDSLRLRRNGAYGMGFTLAFSQGLSQC
jgi:hypothetical protein